ncbi:uncharacterized protein RCC_05871 [Ramularia collo-cygni]|uniref:Conserved oligomeric Golgi complex subunit 1 n=1 Tax=Ramularia collo-cygni TaxID=112498 RepID=A0A2D3VBD5_9PEZI|nr:uncharacterized protein RCC_05871 [Ramularia collo-cygni]CZT20014.1 uncharacterized protein RCC_05871 [Ramularia collo-cygni]
MATLPPTDPKSLTTWEDAFQYPLPIVRKLEQQLRQNIEDHRSKLRSLVGNSYRDLLGTAERIIEMDGQIRQAESYMEDIGRKCNSRAVGRVGGNFARMKKEQEDVGLQRRKAVVAQTKVLQKIIGVVGRIVRGNGDALLGAKVLVLGRLVFKGLVEGEEVAPEVVDGELKRRLGSMRKRLLGYISRTLARRDADVGMTVKALCAYSLISSSSSKEVLRYFLQVRFEQLEAKAEGMEEGRLAEMLELYGNSVLDTKELFPRRFADALAGLSRTALIRDESVRAVYELSLDVYEQWIGEDVRNFHPWVRHDQLSSAEVSSALASWTKQAQSCLLSTLKETIAKQTDAHAVLALRQHLLSKYLSLSAKLRNEEHSRAMDDLRIVFLTRLEELADQAAKMSPLPLDTQLSGTNARAPKVWDLATSDLEPGTGATNFRKAVMERQQGRSAATESLSRTLDDWTINLQQFAEAISSMRLLKWDDDLDLELLEDDDLSDGSESLQMILSKQDPQVLEARLNRSTMDSIKATYSEVEKMGESVEDAALLIRIIRDVDLRRRGLGPILEGIEDKAMASETFIAALQQRVARSVYEVPMGKFEAKRIRGMVALWDGTPALPVQPSPATYRFVKDLHQCMAGSGNDLWSPCAVQALKKMVREGLGGKFEVEHDDGVIDELSKGGGSGASHGHADEAESANAEEATSPSPGNDETRNRLVQTLFDLLYLQFVFHTGAEDESGRLEEVVGGLRKKVDLEPAANERLRKSAGDYWRRTYLLFGLLAG